ncbi:hypothetical protein ABZ474_52240, partial [Streptomyces mirabilis]
MSNSQYETFGLTGTSFEDRGTGGQPPYGVGGPDRGGYVDTYRPAYESLAVSEAPTEPILPRQTPTLVRTQALGDPAEEPRSGRIVRILVEMVDAAGGERGSTPNDPVDGVTLP